MQKLFTKGFLIFVLGLMTGAGLLYVGFSFQREIVSIFGDGFYADDNATTVDDESDSNNDKSKKHYSKKDFQSDIINDSIATSDSLGTLDSLAIYSDSTGNYYAKVDTLPNDDIVLMKDELIYARKYKPAGNPIVFYCEEPGKLDSLLVDNPAIIPKDGLLVEFWKSPVNFKGYRLTRNKLVIYGLYEFDGISFTYQENETLKMNLKDRIFILRCNSDFVPMNFNAQRKNR